MALPTIQFHSEPAGANASTINKFMTKLHELLDDAGWTIVYADADAIGSGSAGDPAWDKTPAPTTSAGIVVYQMPLNDHTTRWFVRIEPSWGTNNNRVYVSSLSIGDVHNGAGGVSGGGAALVTTQPPSNDIDHQHLIATSEDGLFLSLVGAGVSVIAAVERPRRVDTAAVTDDAWAWLVGGTSAARLARAGVGEVHSVIPLALAGVINTGPGGHGGAVANYDGSEIPIVGPFIPRGFPLYSLRLMGFLSAGDHSANSDRAISIDGGPKTYRCPGAVYGSVAWAYLAVATE